MPRRKRWTDQTPAARRRSYLLFSGLYLIGFAIALALGWEVPAVVLAVIGVLLGFLGWWNPEPRRR